MFNRRSSPTRLYCFSPPVMLATFAIEVVLAVYALLRYRHSAVRDIIMSLLFFLAVFQLAEYFVCGGLSLSGMTWSRIGFAVITTLPALSAHLVAELSGQRHRLSLAIIDVVALGLIAFFALSPASVNVALCAGNYVIFHLNGLNAWSYGFYYYGTILAGLMMAAGGIEGAKHSNDRAALRWYVGGILAFLVPTATTNALNPQTIEGIPSIMCGFAILYALVLCFRVLPLSTSRRR